MSNQAQKIPTNNTKNWCNGRRVKNQKYSKSSKIAFMMSNDVFLAPIKKAFPLNSHHENLSLAGKLASNFQSKKYFLKFSRRGVGFQASFNGVNSSKSSLGIVMRNGQSKDFKIEVYNLNNPTQRSAFNSILFGSTLKDRKNIPYTVLTGFEK